MTLYYSLLLFKLLQLLAFENNSCGMFSVIEWGKNMDNKPAIKPKTRKQIQRQVNFIRGIMKIAAKQMVDMESTIGVDTWFETEKGRVRVFTYGFENIEVTPLLVNIHGSGFTMGSAAMDDPFMMQFVEKCNVKVISIDYTLAPDEMFPFALEQCYAVIKYAKEHIEDLNIDAKRIMIMGHSAGGNFCAAIGLMENEKNILGLKGIILDYPPTDIATDAYDKPRPKGALPPRLSRIFDAAYCKPEERSNPLVSPVYATEDMVKNFPPTLIITAGQDSLAAETECFKDTLLRAGVDVTFKRFEGAIHGFTMITEKQAKKFPSVYEKSLAAWKMMVDFVNANI